MMTADQMNLMIQVLAFPAFLVASFAYYAIMSNLERRKTELRRKAQIF